MPSAQGTAFQNSPAKITLVFDVEGRQVTFSADLGISIQPFSVNTTTVTYNDVDDLTSTRSFTGQIGPGHIKLNFDNGTSVTGSLNPPGVSPVSMVAGSGTWQQD
ncbi:unnamed protein product [Fusarium equiseti]|uniref:Uncharacterized protein n=1 Tax=Fusarium equiseti TaxID=61235 RepID=A0A8J2NN44_FUSEQ|nr:unnamed protein product [Fusarium equiseti]